MHEPFPQRVAGDGRCWHQHMPPAGRRGTVMTADRGAEGAVLIGSDGSTHGSMRPAVQIIGATKASTHSDRCNHHHHQRRHALHATRPLLLFAAACVLGAAAGADGRELQAPLLVTAANWGYRSMTVNFVCRFVALLYAWMPPHLSSLLYAWMPPHLSSLPENQPLPLHAALCQTAELVLHYGSHGCHHWLSGCALNIRWL